MSKFHLNLVSNTIPIFPTGLQVLYQLYYSVKFKVCSDCTCRFINNITQIKLQKRAKEKPSRTSTFFFLFLLDSVPGQKTELKVSIYLVFISDVMISCIIDAVIVVLLRAAVVNTLYLTLLLRLHSVDTSIVLIYLNLFMDHKLDYCCHAEVLPLL